MERMTADKVNSDHLILLSFVPFVTTRIIRTWKNFLETGIFSVMINYNELKGGRIWRTQQKTATISSVWRGLVRPY